MTREEAIKNLQEDGVDLGAGDFVEVEALRMAIAALREQEERSKACEYCEADSEGYRSVFGAYHIARPFHGNSFQIRGGNLKPREIHFCPMCGRKLEAEG